MDSKIMLWFIMKLLHLYYKSQNKRYRHELVWIKGTEKDFPKIMLYTENKNIRSELMDVAYK